MGLMSRHESDVYEMLNEINLVCGDGEETVGEKK